ncbi:MULTISPECIES: C40 family peptidase [unclassified Cryobacterium]|uniref:C40 family peptidase n=1 Tax=unclassified Cryobacterium TaxID=2649013 RepID=UPI002AB48AB8|nr:MULTISPECIES: NlpC/P60 family protein [unclassified Cryobacterium]MDY7542422.1 NlpC/P60 family protein [Cryobacterium sp. 5B3]MEB0000324.1 NlpC/P60 family protein [Cryobacterium sp. RTS3]MEB0267010.1 NlpC/P60 family protein [Cryobacterium sp. 10I5]MEB0275050.1 NlpC/P60 family protein [Cryobacterium sp. 5B3]
MANDGTSFTRRKPVRLFAAAVAIGAVSASVGIIAPAAYGDQGYPSWDDVQKAKANEATKQAEIEKITTLLTGLQTAADAASKASQIAAEAYRVAQDELDAATLRETSLTEQAATASKKADTSKMRAGLIAAHLAKTGAQDLSLNLFLNGSSADDLLEQLGTASKLSEQSETIYREAVQDKNSAESLGGQAAAATAERTRLTGESMTKFDAASSAAQSAEAALEAEQQKSNDLYGQLALLKDTTADTERSYQAGVDAAAAAAALAAAQSAAAAKAAADQAASAARAAAAAAAAQAQPPAASGGGNSGSGSSGSGNSGSGSSGSGSSSGGGAATAPAPNASAVQTAIAFARQQLGDRYLLGGSGPDAWDCSGLTKAAYAAAGVYIGTHSATNQYNTMASQGRLVSFSNVQVGDLVFWGGGGDYYHVAIYVGGGQVLEAPDVGKPVRIHAIWSPGDVASYVGRPTG